MSTFLGPILWLPSVLYGLVMRFRNFLYNHGVLASHRVDAPVVSVGNLTAGGTGKTPITAYLLEQFAKRGWHAGVISRGYGVKVPSGTRVETTGRTESAMLFGDEPSWLALRYPDRPVFVGADKVSTAQALIASEKTKPVEILIADDGFQHRRLRRQIDLVLIDATEPRWHYRSLPLGRMREGFSSLTRAQFVFITKTNLAPTSQVDWLTEQIAQVSNAKLRVYKFKSEIEGFVRLNESDVLEILPQPLAVFGVNDVLLVSGIGRPETFSQIIGEIDGVAIREHLIFRDHHAYSAEDRSRIEARARELNVNAIVMTEKDAVKLRGWAPEFPAFVSRLQARPVADLGAFYDFVDRTIHGTHL